MIGADNFVAFEEAGPQVFLKGDPLPKSFENSEFEYVLEVEIEKD